VIPAYGGADLWYDVPVTIPYGHFLERRHRMKHPTWIIAFAGCLFAAGSAQAAVIVLGSPKSQECFMAAKAVAQLGNRDIDSGLAVCDQALSEGGLDAHDSAGTHINRGVLYATKGSHDLAMADYQEGIRLAPNLGDAYVDRGAALIFLKRYDEAMADINKGIDLGLSYPYTGYYNRAVAEFFKGQYKESYFDYKRVLEIAPDFKPAQDQLKNFIVTTVPAKGS
jgi:tetratricopeptide (TPR) repeat protein